MQDLPKLVQQVRAGVVDCSAATRPRAHGYWALLALSQQTLAAPTATGLQAITLVK